MPSKLNSVEIIGWIIPYYYRVDTIGLNYGVWFLPKTNYTVNLLNGLLDSSQIFGEHLLTASYITNSPLIFEKIFANGLHLSIRIGEYYCKDNHEGHSIWSEPESYTFSATSMLASLIKQFSFPDQLNNNDTIIVFKSILVETVISLYPYDSTYQELYFDELYYSISGYDRIKGLSYAVLDNSKLLDCCYLDKRRFSYVYGIITHVRFENKDYNKYIRKTNRRKKEVMR
jgi:hypothetical protein